MDAEGVVCCTAEPWGHCNIRAVVPRGANHLNPKGQVTQRHSTGHRLYRVGGGGGVVKGQVRGESFVFQFVSKFSPRNFFAQFGALPAPCASATDKESISLAKVSQN